MKNKRIRDYHLICSISELRRLGLALAGQVQEGDVFLMKGDLGAGKTELARAIIRSLCCKDLEVISPTFTFLQVYDYEENSKIYHYDLYRLDCSSKDIWEIGLEDALSSSLTIIEWPERLPPELKFRQGLSIKIIFPRKSLTSKKKLGTRIVYLNKV